MGREVAAAVTASLGLGLAVVLLWGSGGLADVAAVAVGAALVAGVAGSLLLRRPRWSGPGDHVTLVRTVLGGGCASIVVLVVAGGLPARTWWLAGLAAVAVALDAVDGAVARRTGTASAPGARLDGEVDAALLLILSGALAGPLGAWVLAVGGMRYAFGLAGLLRPRLRAPLARSDVRRAIAGAQGAAFVVALVPAVPLGLARVVVAAALALLVFSFGRDVLTLERAAGPRRVPQ